MQQKIETADDSFCAYALRPFVAGDTAAYVAEIQTDGAESYLKVTAKRSDGSIVTCAGKKSAAGTASCVLDASLYNQPGKLVLRFAVVSGNSCLTVREIHADVLEAF